MICHKVHNSLKHLLQASTCLFMEEESCDFWVMELPMLTILAFNTFFLIWIISVGGRCHFYRHLHSCLLHILPHLDNNYSDQVKIADCDPEVETAESHGPRSKTLESNKSLDLCHATAWIWVKKKITFIKGKVSKSS